MMDNLYKEKTNRKLYWDNKYLKQNIYWGDDIHFGVFANEDFTFSNLLSSIKLNTEILTREIFEIASVYSLSKRITILDFGCGSGDLLFRLSSLLPDAICVGIDLSENAIKKANERKEKTDLSDQKKLNIEFIEGGIEKLQDVKDKYGNNNFDLIVCRDMYYLLFEEEQNILMENASKLLKQSGVFILADFAVSSKAKKGIDENLILRQHGGKPISFEMTDENISFSIQQLFDKYDLIEIKSPEIDHTAVSYSYSSAAAAANDNLQIQQKYEVLSTLAQPITDNKGNLISNVPYVKFYLKLQPCDRNASMNYFGINIKEDFYFKSRSSNKKIFQRGQWMFPLNKWSLIIGKSGIGKTTLLNLIAQNEKRHNVELLHVPSKIFYLQQDPILIDELSVEANLALFSQNKHLLNKILTDLGLNKNLRNRIVKDSLSGGERQRVAFGQAIVSQPDLLLLDEPCTGMDKALKYQFLALLRNELKNLPISILCVDHDYDFIESFFDHVYEINNSSLYLISPKD